MKKRSETQADSSAREKNRRSVKLKPSSFELHALCEHFDASEKKKQRAENTNANCQLPRFDAMLPDSVCFSFNFLKIAKTD